MFPRRRVTDGLVYGEEALVAEMSSSGLRSHVLRTRSDDSDDSFARILAQRCESYFHTPAYQLRQVSKGGCCWSRCTCPSNGKIRVSDTNTFFKCVLWKALMARRAFLPSASFKSWRVLMWRMRC